MALSRFVDDLSVLAIEDCLIGKVSELFRSNKVLNMSPEDISRLAGETTESFVERQRLVEKHKTLDAGLRGLKSLKTQRQFAHSTERDSVSPEGVASMPNQTTLDSENASVVEVLEVVSQDEVDPSLGGDLGSLV